MTGSLLRDFAAEQGFPLDDFQVEACLAVEGGRASCRERVWIPV